MAGRRLARLSYLMIYPGMQRRLLEMLGMDTGFWCACVNVTFRRKVPFIRVRALTQKGKFRKLLARFSAGFTARYEVLYGQARQG